MQRQFSFSVIDYQKWDDMILITINNRLIWHNNECFNAIAFVYPQCVEFRSSESDCDLITVWRISSWAEQKPSAQPWKTISLILKCCLQGSREILVQWVFLGKFFRKATHKIKGKILILSPNFIFNHATKTVA